MKPLSKASVEAERQAIDVPKEPRRYALYITLEGRTPEPLYAKVLQEIARERPVYDRAAAAFYRVRRKAQKALKP